MSSRSSSSRLEVNDCPEIRSGDGASVDVDRGIICKIPKGSLRNAPSSEPMRSLFLVIILPGEHLSPSLLDMIGDAEVIEQPSICMSSIVLKLRHTLGALRTLIARPPLLNPRLREASPCDFNAVTVHSGVRDDAHDFEARDTVVTGAGRRSLALAEGGQARDDVDGGVKGGGSASGGSGQSTSVSIVGVGVRLFEVVESCVQLSGIDGGSAGIMHRLVYQNRVDCDRAWSQFFSSLVWVVVMYL